MATAVTVCDATSSGERVRTFELELASERISARELIRRRVEHEVTEYNQALPGYFQGLVQPLAVAPPRHQPAGELIDDNHFTVFDDIVHIPFEQRVRL